MTLKTTDKLSMFKVRELLKHYTDEEILAHFRSINYSVPATQDMIKRAKIKDGTLARTGCHKDFIRTWHRPKEPNTWFE